MWSKAEHHRLPMDESICLVSVSAEIVVGSAEPQNAISPGFPGKYMFNYNS